MDPEELLAELARREEGRGSPEEAGLPFGRIIRAFVDLASNRRLRKEGDFLVRGQFREDLSNALETTGRTTAENDEVFGRIQNRLEGGLENVNARFADEKPSLGLFMRDLGRAVFGESNSDQVMRLIGRNRDDFDELLQLAKDDNARAILEGMDIGDRSREIANSPEFVRQFAQALENVNPQTGDQFRRSALEEFSQRSNQRFAVQNSVFRGATGPGTSEQMDILEAIRDLSEKGRKNPDMVQATEAVDFALDESFHADFLTNPERQADVFGALMEDFVRDQRHIAAREAMFPSLSNNITFSSMRHKRDLEEAARRAKIERARGIR